MSNFIKKIFFKPKLSFEAFEAYFNRMPEEIYVRWKRDGKFIVGRVKAGEYEFITQGKDGDDFVDMVNDSIVTVYDIPEDYVDLIKAGRTYKPKKEEMEKLECKEVLHSDLFFTKNKKVLQFA